MKLFLNLWRKNESRQSRGVLCTANLPTSAVRRPMVAWKIKLRGGFIELEVCLWLKLKRDQPIERYGDTNLHLLAETERSLWRQFKAALREGRAQQNPAGCYQGTIHERQGTLRSRCSSARALAGRWLARASPRHHNARMYLP